MSAPLKTMTVDEQRVARLTYRMRYIPLGIARAQSKLLRIEREATDLGMHDLVTLLNSHHAGDRIASEWLKRLGVEP